MLAIATAPVLALGLVLLTGRLLVGIWLLMGCGALAAAQALLHRRRRDRAMIQRAGRVAAACDLMSAELRSGRPTPAALRAAAGEWPELAGVVRAEVMGGDVVQAWRRAARLPGADDLRLVAAAWFVSERSGAGLADTLTRVAALIRADAATRRTVAAELSSARATARLIAALPVVGLLVGGSAGGDPVAFLFTEPLGLVCLGAGGMLGWLGLWWIERIAADVARS